MSDRGSNRETTCGEALRVARQKIEFHRIRNAAVVRADAARLPCADHSFDLVVSNLGLNNFESPEAVLAECHRVTRAGGRLVLTTNPSGTLEGVYDSFGHVLAGLSEEAARRLRLEEAKRGTLEGLCQLVERAGFSVLRSVDDRFDLRFVDGSTALRHSLMAWFVEAWRKLLDPEIEEEAFRRLEVRLNDHAAASGHLVLSVPVVYVEAVR